MLAVVSVFDDQITALSERLKVLDEEIKPLQRERSALLRSIKNLKEERERVEDPEGYRARKKREYVSLKQRKQQVRDLLDRVPDATNIEIAREIGTSPARVSQIRKELGNSPKKGTVRRLDGM